MLSEIKKQILRNIKTYSIKMIKFRIGKSIDIQIREQGFFQYGVVRKDFKEVVNHLSDPLNQKFLLGREAEVYIAPSHVVGFKEGVCNIL